MARYINEDEFVAWVKEHWCADCQNDNGLRCRACWIDDAIDIVEEAPEADVVPKSEVAKEFTCFVGDPHKVDHCPYLDEIEKAKTELASEIFAEIDKIRTTERAAHKRGVGDYYNSDSEYTKLKKKYTEGE